MITFKGNRTVGVEWRNASSVWQSVKINKN